MLSLLPRLLHLATMAPFAEGEHALRAAEESERLVLEGFAKRVEDSR